MLLSKKQLSAMILYSPAHIDRLEDENSPYFDPAFPKRIKIGNNRVGWLKSEADSWLQAKVEQRDNAL